MSKFKDVRAFVRDLRGAPTLTDIGLIMKDATRSFEFDHFALAQRLSGAGKGGRGARAAGGSNLCLGPVRLTDFPDEWLEQLMAGGLIADDPVLLACERSVTPFAWNRLETLVPMTGRHRAYMAQARAAGLVDGYTVPIHGPGEASGLVSFVLSKPRALPDDMLPAAQYLACFAFEAARRLKQADQESTAGEPRPTLSAPRLTQRQLDCVVLAARGKSNWVAGQLLGLSDGTVHKYLEAAKRRYGVSSRTELVVRCLYDGHLSFSDVMGTGMTADAVGDRRGRG